MVYITDAVSGRAGLEDECEQALTKQFSGKGVNKAICRSYTTKEEAESNLLRIANAEGRAIGSVAIVPTEWTYNAIDSDGGALFERHVEGRGSTQEGALSDGKNRAHDGFASDIAQWGPTRCSSLPGRVPLWFCDVDFWVKAKETVLSTFPRTNEAFGKTMAEAVWAAKESSQNSFPVEIQYWETPTCVDVPSRSPRWKCSVDSVVQVYKKQ